MRKDNHLYGIEIREVDKEKKRIKIHNNILAKIEMSIVTMVPYLTSKDFTVSSPSAPQLHHCQRAIRAKTLGWRGGSRIEPRKTGL